MASAINIMQDRITRSRMAGDPPELVLDPRLEHLGLLEACRATEAIEEGRACVERSGDAIGHLLDRHQRHQAPAKRLGSVNRDLFLTGYTVKCRWDLLTAASLPSRGFHPIFPLSVDRCGQLGPGKANRFHRQG